MVVLTVKFKSAMSEAEVIAAAEARADQFRALDGLLQKYYVHDPATGEFGGIYIWDSMESLQTYRESDLAKSIPEAYQVEGTPRIDVMNVIMPLR